jgi:predicted dehydrogenase
MNTSFGWAIVGPGAIAHRFADAVHRSPGTHIAMVQGRELARASTFAQTWTREGVTAIAAAESLDAAMTDPAVDGVYIATPHPFHAETIERCLRAHKPVLCEKPLVTDARTAGQLCALSRETNTFLMEAVWTRFLPIYDVVGGWLQHHEIGAIRGMQSSFCFNTPWNPTGRHFDPAQAGGTLLDIGIYNLTVTRRVLQQALGHCPDALAIDAHGVICPTGVDHRVAASLRFADGLTSQFVCAFDSDSDNEFRIFGEHGRITVGKPFWGASSATLAKNNDAPLTINQPFRINGFEYEIEAAISCIREGRTECPRIPHDETVQTLRWIDQLRADIGVRYPFDDQNSVVT